MMAGNETMWPQEIRRHTISLIIVIAFFGVAATSYVLWEKWRSEQTLLIINDFHLASSFHSSAAREETNRLLAHVQHVLSGRESDIDQFILPGFDPSLSVRFVKGRVAQIVELQARYDDPRFAFLADKIAREAAVLDGNGAEFRDDGNLNPRLAVRLQSLITALGQFDRLHAIVYEDLIEAREAQRGRDTTIVIAFVMAMLLFGFVTVRKGLHAIERTTARQREAEEELRKAKVESELASSAKSEFLASMSHELRTPLNSILGYSQMLGSNPMMSFGEMKRIEYARDIQRAGQHLLSLIEDILDLSTIEAGEVVFYESEVALAEIFEDAVRLIEGLAKNRSVTVRIDSNLPPMALYADRRRLTQIVINLLSNAVKFNKVNGLVHLSAVLLPDALAVVVSDTGIGIPAQEIDKVLEPFAQVRTSPHLAHEGTGLGLALSKHLAELHGGRLDIRSEEGVGTTVQVLFPVAPAPERWGRSRSRTGRTGGGGIEPQWWSISCRRRSCGRTGYSA